MAWLWPVLAGIFSVAAMTSVARSSGSGWVQAVGALLAAVLATGFVAPLFPVRRAQVICTQCPADAVAGRNISFTLLANGPIRVRPLSLTGPDVQAVGSARGRRQVVIVVMPNRRGVVESVRVEVASSAPFGMLWWARESLVLLPRPLHVAPRLGTPGHVAEESDDNSGDALRRKPSVTGEARGVRSYQPGDLQHAVHWPSTAHTGALMVSESETPVDEQVVVEVTLPPDPEEAERAAERVMSVVAAHLSKGAPVLLSTLETGGRIVRPVLDRIELGRRLARAVSSP